MLRATRRGVLVLGGQKIGIIEKVKILKSIDLSAVCFDMKRPCSWFVSYTMRLCFYALKFICEF